MNKVVPIDKSSTILTILLACIFFHEGLSLAKIGCVCMIGVGTMLMITRKEDVESNSSDKKLVDVCDFVSVFASLTSILGKIGISGIDSNLGTAIRTSVVLVMAWLMVFVKNKQSQIKDVDRKELFVYHLIWFCNRRILAMFLSCFTGWTCKHRCAL